MPAIASSCAMVATVHKVRGRRCLYKLLEAEKSLVFNATISSPCTFSLSETNQRKVHAIPSNRLASRSNSLEI
jgi:hypothetical protein